MKNLQISVNLTADQSAQLVDLISGIAKEAQGNDAVLLNAAANHFVEVTERLMDAGEVVSKPE